MQTIFITGSNGLTGQKLLAQAQNLDTTRIIAIAKSENKAKLPPNAIFAQIDLTDKAKLAEIFAKYSPQIVIHTAALTLPDSCEQDKANAYLQNVTVVENLLEVCKKTQSFLLHFSTDFVFDGKKGKYSEDDITNPISYYGFTKAEAEKKIMASLVPFAIIRTCLVYGKNPHTSRSNIVDWVKNNLEKGNAIRVVNDQFRTPTLVDDLARATWAIALQKHTGIWHISGNEYLTPYQMAIQTANFFGLDASLISATNATEFIEIAKRPLKTGFTIAKAQEILGFMPHTFAEGLAKMQTQANI
jgi:dTDP-4-dehydrorhamnose reductase